ncbi:N-acetyl-D-glucosamine kinase [Anthophora plagiata]
MAGKRKGKGKGKRKKVDEYELRREIRKQRRSTILSEDQLVMSEVKLPEHPEEIRIGGIEGGATYSTLVIIDGEGTQLTEIKGPSTNHWQFGIEETTARINAMVERGKQMIEIPDFVPLDSLGLCLSGCEEEATNQLILETMQTKYPNVAKTYFISSDTLGSLRTALDTGGIVLIAGTGSNALLVNSDGKIESCGGWGHFIGDEGSASWIAHRACKYVFDHLDDFAQSPKPINYVWPAMRHYFNITNRKELLPHFYVNFNKTFYSMFTKEIVIGCEKKDPLCLHLFKENGIMLAKHIIALSKKAHNELKLAHGGLKILCVGSVWKSWDLMRNAFVNEIHESKTVDELTMIRLTVSSGIGACYLAAEKINWVFTKPYEKNFEVFYRYKRENYVKPQEDLTESSIVFVPCSDVKED